MNRGLVFYERSSDFTEYYSAAGGNLAKLGELPGSGRQWTNIVAAPYYNTNFSGLLFYEARTGTGHFCMPFNDGLRFSPGFRNEHTGWRTAWTHIVAGNFGGPSGADLLFYDPSTGTGEFYREKDVVENGMLQVKLVHLRTHRDWRTSWTHVIPGQFGGDGLTDLLFYDASSGAGEFYAVDGQGRIRLLAQHTSWRTSWRHIVPGNFGGSSHTDLLFYDDAAGTGEFYATNQGRIELLQGYSDWRPSWNAIVPGDFAGNGRTSLLFYDAAAGVGEFYATDQGGIQLIGQGAGWRTTWSTVVAFDSELRGGGEF